MADREYVEPIDYNLAQVRTEFTTRRGVVSRFVVQLEYNINQKRAGKPQWWQVARFDHNPSRHNGHDVSREGLHMDVYRNRQKRAVTTNFPHVKLHQAIDFCEKYFEKNAAYLLARFEEWHNLKKKRYAVTQSRRA